MNEFSEKLQNYMTEANLTGKRICELLDISTSSFSRLKKGEKKTYLTKNQLLRLFKALKLNREQSEELWDMYDLCGYSQYDKKCVNAVKEILCRKWFVPVPEIEFDADLDFSAVKTAKGVANVEKLIFSAFAQMNKSGSEDKIYVLSQMKNESFAKVLRAALGKFPNTGMCHLLNLISSRNEGYYADNFISFLRVAPFLAKCENYSVNFNYCESREEVDSDSRAILFFGNFTLGIAEDMSCAAVFTDQNARRERFIKEYERCFNVHKSNRNGFFDDDFLRRESNQVSLKNVEIFDYSLCVKFFLEKEDVLRTINYHPIAEQLAEIVTHLKNMYVRDDLNVNHFFSKSGFIKTFKEGWYAESDVLKNRIPPDVRLNLLKNMKNMIITHPQLKLFMYDDEFIRINPLLEFELKDNGYVLMFITDRAGNPMRCIIREPSVYIALSVFFDYFKKSRYIADKSELLLLAEECERQLTEN